MVSDANNQIEQQANDDDYCVFDDDKASQRCMPRLLQVANVAANCEDVYFINFEGDV